MATATVEIDAEAYDALLAAAETYRAALVVRLAGEAGLRTAEIPRIRPIDVRQVRSEPDRYLLSVPDDDGETARAAYLPASLAGELDRYASSMGIGDEEPYVDVSPRRVQMLVVETGEHAVERHDVGGVADAAGEAITLDSAAGDASAVESAAIDSALERVTPRSLRQYFARTLLTDRGVDPRVVRAIGGWETLDALDPYLQDPDEAEIISAMGDGESATDVPTDGIDWLSTIELDDDGRIRGWTKGARTLTGYQVCDVAGRHLATLYGDDEGGAAGEDVRAALDGSCRSIVRWLERADGTPTRVRLEFTADGAGVSVLLADLRTANAGAKAPGLVDVLEAVVESEGRAELLSTVPERLVDSPRWTFAWIATRGRGDSGTTIESSAGLDAAALSERGLTSSDPDSPWMQALDREEPVVGDVNSGDRSLVAVPISHHEAVYGVLCAVPVGTQTVDDEDRRTLSVVGEGVARAITSFRWRDLLHSDAVLELEFVTSVDDAFLVRLSDQLGCTVELNSTIPVSDAALLSYVDVDGATPQDVAPLADAADGVEETRVVETHGDGCSLSFVVTGESPVYTLTEHGATIREATATNGELRVVADVPTGTDVRPIADGLRSSFPDVRLIGKEAVDRPTSNGTELQEGILDSLTDRQRTTVEAAYHGGYFDWPRESTAEEIADAMDVSSPTFHNHLRKAQRALLDVLFEERESGRR